MTSRQIELIESSWDYVLMNTREAGLLFYEELFVIDPALRHLFKGDMTTQAQKLVAMIAFLIHKLDDLDELMKDVRELGVRHSTYNVQPEHYVSVGQALVWMLEKGMGEEWTDEHRDAWMRAYTILSDTMITATQKQPGSIV